MFAIHKAAEAAARIISYIVGKYTCLKFSIKMVKGISSS